jgi:hypothetical protein
MSRLAALIVATLALPGTALAAPPANDNRVDAEAILTFPQTIAGSTVEATVERLDPQVSRCGRVEGTVWYRIDTAPDGLISVTVAGGQGVAPVVRVYRRGGSAIQQLDCASAGPGGTASASLEAVRGSTYLVLVGRRPGSADGSFELRAELFLPPPNDDRGGAQAIRLPGSIRGTTLGATGGEADPGRCGLDGGTVWYRVAGRRDGRALLRLTAAGQLDAAIVVLERVRSRTTILTCAVTDRRGRASVGFPVRRGATYLVAVGHVESADPGTFRIEAVLSEAAESLRAGKALPRGGTRSTLHGLTDVNDVWRVSMQPGITYRIGFSSASCASVSLRGTRRLARILLRLDCSGYRTFTPGPDGGRGYVFDVQSGGEPTTHRYRLQFAAAAPDDLGVGVELQNRSPRRGSLDPGRLDLQDVYHFDVARRGDVRIEVTGGLRVRLLTDGGQGLGVGSSLRRQLSPGRYVVAVTATVGEPGVRYTLSLLIREITSTSLRFPIRTVAPGQTISIRPEVANASTGVVEIQIDRFDPLTGWHFNRLLRTTVGGSVAWVPPAEGRWRLRASFKGTTEASPSRSGTVGLEVRRS